MAEPPDLEPPRYRVELRVPGEAGYIVGFADSPLVAGAMLRRKGGADSVALAAKSIAAGAPRHPYSPPVPRRVAGDPAGGARSFGRGPSGTPEPPRARRPPAWTR